MYFHWVVVSAAFVKTQPAQLTAARNVCQGLRQRL